MDFRDSAAEADFRARLRAWLADNHPGLPTSSTDDEYWARQAEWHTALYDAGFFGLSWPKKHGGHELPTVFDVTLPTAGAWQFSFTLRVSDFDEATVTTTVTKGCSRGCTA